uniref:Reverse transcriptase domain-containing protein n=1 Tax=Paramormyrops kingsleyae TaxID=1676925 RepID=A0A3B3RQM9_9TELE
YRIVQFRKKNTLFLLTNAKQGCPLSLLLFNLSLEPRAAGLRHSDLISPILVKDVPQKVSLYADDLLLYLGNAPTDLPHILNLSKSSLLPLNPACRSSSFHSSIPQTDSFRYLGLDIYPSVPELTAAGFRRVLEGIKISISSWSLSLSFQVRLAIIKINVLQRTNFVSSLLPPSVKHSTLVVFSSMLKLLHKTLITKNAQLSGKTMDRLDGGVALPDFELYHHAFTLRELDQSSPASPCLAPH